MNKITIRADQIQNDDELALRVGTALVQLLGLEADNIGKYYTSYGDKTRIGLARTIVNVISEIK